jgi:hypothetical protein
MEAGYTGSLTLVRFVEGVGEKRVREREREREREWMKRYLVLSLPHCIKHRKVFAIPFTALPGAGTIKRRANFPFLQAIYIPRIGRI